MNGKIWKEAIVNFYQFLGKICFDIKSKSSILRNVHNYFYFSPTSPLTKCALHIVKSLRTNVCIISKQARWNAKVGK